MRTLLPAAACTALVLWASAASGQSTADQTWRGTQAGTFAGQSMEVGPVNAVGGRNDLIIGAPGSSTIPGAVYVVFAGTARTGDQSLANADVVITSFEPGNFFGASTATGNITSLTGSAAPNLVVGAPGASGGRGAVYVFRGGYAPGTHLSTADVLFTIVGNPGDQMGTSLATGDLDNDGYREIIIGAGGGDRAYIITGGPSPADIRSFATTRGGSIVAAGDVTGDGIADAVIGSGDLNIAFLYRGRTGSLPTVPDAQFTGVRDGDRAGASLRVFDIDHDGIADIIIGAPGEDGPAINRPDSGAVYVLWGSAGLASRSLTQADVTFYGATAGLQLGTYSAAGDVNRDTPGDMVMMGPGGAAGEHDVYYGRSNRSAYGVDAGSGLRVVDFADAANIDLRITGNPALGVIGPSQVFAATDEGARDIAGSVPTENNAAGAVYFTTMPSLALSTQSVALALNSNAALNSAPVSVTNRSLIGLSWAATSDRIWLSGVPATGSTNLTAPGGVSVRANTSGLAPGVYSGTVSVTSTSRHLVASVPISVALTVTDTLITIDTPASGATLTEPFALAGWAIDRASATGTGVDAVHVFAARNDGSGAAAIFVGAATYGVSRPDLGQAFGARFTQSGYQIAVAGLPAGPYRLIAYARHAATGGFTAVATRDVTVNTAGAMWIDTPAPSATVTSAFEVGGWAIDPVAPSGTGVDAVQFYIFPNDGLAGPVFIGTGSYGWTRPDVAAIFGSRFNNSGYHFTITGMSPGNYLLGVYAHSTASNAYSIIKTEHITVSATALMSIDVPTAEATITAGGFDVSGWAIDRAAPSGTGVDMLHVYAYPNPESSNDPAIFLGFANMGIARGDVGSVYGARFTNSGYGFVVDTVAAGLSPGVYNIVVWAHSTATNSFNNVALVRVRIQ
jgi:hypothetical protein